MYYMEKDRPFKHRKDAGMQLGEYLKPMYATQSPLVIGIPRGGIEVGYYVASILEADFALVVSRKLPFPDHKEVGFGAVAEESEVYVSDVGWRTFDAEIIEGIISEQLVEVQRRIDTYRGGLPLPGMAGRLVILVDDGIATGVTLVPVIRLCRKKKAEKIVVAAPVSGTRYDPRLDEADAINILFQPEEFYGVGQAYESFGDFTDQEVLALLKPDFK